jgi:hypothetical protein
MESSAFTRFGLARARWVRGAVDEALELAEQARAEMRIAGQTTLPLHAEIDRWLTTHQRP